MRCHTADRRESSADLPIEQALTSTEGFAPIRGLTSVSIAAAHQSSDEGVDDRAVVLRGHVPRLLVTRASPTRVGRWARWSLNDLDTREACCQCKRDESFDVRLVPVA